MAELQLFHGLFRHDVAIRHTDLNALVRTPYECENRAMRGASPGRKAEFFTGRACARQALAVLGIPSCSIPMRIDRSPAWPDEIVGSISHAAHVCVAAVARKRDGYYAIGVDLEPAIPIEFDLVDDICGAEERNWLLSQPQERRGNLLTLIFSAKEAAYKCQYPLSQEIIDFHALDVHLEPILGDFTARFVKSVGPFRQGDVICGRYNIASGMIATAAVL